MDLPASLRSEVLPLVLQSHRDVRRICKLPAAVLIYFYVTLVTRRIAIDGLAAPIENEPDLSQMLDRLFLF